MVIPVRSSLYKNYLNEFPVRLCASKRKKYRFINSEEKCGRVC